MNLSRNLFCALLLAALTLRAQDAASWRLQPQALADDSGVYLDEVISCSSVIPHLRLARAPALGQSLVLSRDQVADFIRQNAPALSSTNVSGPGQLRVLRRMRSLEEPDVIDLLTAALQKDFVKNEGELELHLTRPWPKTAAPDESLTLKIVELPSLGLSPNFVVSFEIWNGKERVGAWQLAVQAAIWRDIPVAHSTLARGQLLRDADITLERGDALVHRNVFPNFPTTDFSLELNESVPAGMPILNRYVRVRPLIQRGQIVEGVFQEGTLAISLMVESLQDGLRGQTVRVRNPKTQRELEGKVENEKTVRIVL